MDRKDGAVSSAVMDNLYRDVRKKLAMARIHGLDEAFAVCRPYLPPDVVALLEVRGKTLYDEAVYGPKEPVA